MAQRKALSLRKNSGNEAGTGIALPVSRRPAGERSSAREGLYKDVAPGKGLPGERVGRRLPLGRNHGSRFLV